MNLVQSIIGALAQKYDESKPVIDSELIVFATDKQIESLAKWDALSKEGNKTAGAFAFALRLKLARAMEQAREVEAEDQNEAAVDARAPLRSPRSPRSPRAKKVVRARAAK